MADLVEKQPIVCIDIKEDEAQSDGVAYFRMTEGLKDFLEKCHSQHGILGFEFHPGEWNLGVILKHVHTGPAN